jgi:hypothetical protein
MSRAAYVIPRNKKIAELWSRIFRKHGTWAGHFARHIVEMYGFKAPRQDARPNLVGISARKGVDVFLHTPVQVTEQAKLPN